MVPVVGEDRDRAAVADDLAREGLPVGGEDESLDVKHVARRQLLGRDDLGREPHVN